MGYNTVNGHKKQSFFLKVSVTAASAACLGSWKSPQICCLLMLLYLLRSKQPVRNERNRLQLLVVTSLTYIAGCKFCSARVKVITGLCRIVLLVQITLKQDKCDC